MTGQVLRIERSSIHDGPGLRTVVFLKGCPLRCRWCSTPESWHAEPQTDCRGKVYGRAMSPQAVLDEVLKDEVFYFHSGGGITLSGGEPLMQPTFAAEILGLCRQSGIHTAMETSLWADFHWVRTVVPLVDHLFVDLKHSDSFAHRRLTGVENGTILENLARLKETGFKGELILRMPIIPGLNDDSDNLRQTASIASALPQLRHIQLLPYHRLGLETYRRLELDYPLAGVTPPSHQHMQACAAAMNAAAPQLKVTVGG